MTDPLRVHFYTLTDTHASEHVYMAALREALLAGDVVEVDDWRDADVVHCFEVNAFTRAALSEFRYLELLRIVRSDVPLVVSTDDLYFIGEPELTARPRLYPLNHRVQRRLFRASDAVVAISDSVGERLEPHLPRTPIHTVRHGVDSAYFAGTDAADDVDGAADAADADDAGDADGSDADAGDAARTDDASGDAVPFVMHVSLASKRKNPDAVLEAARRLDDRFVVAGSSWPDLVPDDPAYEHLETPGFVPEAELVELYRDAGVFYFPTLHEGFGLPVLEAMAAGCAVVTSDVYSVPEVADDAALLFDPRDVDAHVDAIRRLLADDDERASLGAAARERASEFSWERAARETASIYREVSRL